MKWLFFFFGLETGDDHIYAGPLLASQPQPGEAKILNGRGCCNHDDHVHERLSQVLGKSELHSPLHASVFLKAKGYTPKQLWVELSKNGCRFEVQPLSLSASACR